MCSHHVAPNRLYIAALLDQDELDSGQHPVASFFFDLRSPAYDSSSPAELRRRATATVNLCLTLTFYEPSYFNTTGTKEEKAVEILIRSGAITEGRRLSGSQRG